MRSTLLPDFDTTKLWYPPQAINEMGKPLRDATNTGLDMFTGPDSMPNCPNSFEPQAYNSPSVSITQRTLTAKMSII